MQSNHGSTNFFITKRIYRKVAMFTVTSLQYFSWVHFPAGHIADPALLLKSLLSFTVIYQLSNLNSSILRYNVAGLMLSSFAACVLLFLA